ncbi:MAG: KpsF/GutQ family sugar-phosphate isomerase [Rhodospirillales bacterium]|jgi:arabinose-5-phosphate isomerase|nr:KpsF/GutQ family sugar-phosphate isomerase [Rhodospirillaceae bacterium]MDP6429040.1 KpsF/GutQ family sugar-phosphate isomerase [Rhodospirillales bacterium]MDP6642462.1 KpsF/GutQ family sugar-phosphate isomerase [Rhodospirillales bacterium]
MTQATSPEADLDIARRVLGIESKGLQALAQSLDAKFSRAIDIFDGRTGRIIVTGMGKSGHVAHKVASTLSSTGMPALFVHPAEASHGDLGMIENGDAVLAYSNSGETPELSDIIAYTRRFKLPLVAVTSQAASAISEQADVTLVLPPAEEACAIGMAPTTSTTMMMALGDALAVALMERKGFTADDFKLRHPGGQLGKLLLKVSDIMHTGASLPLAEADETMANALVEMTQKSLGVIGVVDGDDRLLGIVTDGDLRRHMSDDLMARRAGEVMTKNPKTIRSSALASEAVQVMNEMQITSLFVVDDGRVAGVLHIHDCLRAGVV